MLRYEKLRNSDLISEEFGTKQYVKNLTEAVRENELYE